ncbi:MAG TPA: hypothetical protein VFW19_05625 [Allosphingosinicella sp.]|nr:hypothetical protein [Allosphingosinicella sp.]
MNSPGPKADSNEGSIVPTKDAWEKPEILSYSPARNAEGLRYNPGDGISNLTP